MNKLSHGQTIVLGQHLADYPDDVSFEDVLDMIENGDDEVTVWIYFEDWDTETFTEHLTKLANAIDKAIVEVKEQDGYVENERHTGMPSFNHNNI